MSGSSQPAPRWPFCRRCGRTAMPGVPCAEARCPWQRVEGRIITPGQK